MSLTGGDINGYLQEKNCDGLTDDVFIYVECSQTIQAHKLLIVKTPDDLRDTAELQTFIS